MKRLIQKLFGIDKIIDNQKKTNELLNSICNKNRELIKLTTAYNKAYHIT